MGLVVVVDDERTFAGHVDVYLRTEDEAMLWFAKWWNNNLYVPLGAETWLDQVWFDHDLGEGNGTGLAAARFFAGLVGSSMEGWPVPVCVNEVLVHSQNPVGAEAVYGELRSRLYGHVLVNRVPLPLLEGQRNSSKKKDFSNVFSSYSSSK